MRHDFDPADWLNRWREAGGGWTDRYLLRPRNTGDLPALASLASELDDDRRQAVLLTLAGGSSTIVNRNMGSCWG